MRFKEEYAPLTLHAKTDKVRLAIGPALQTADVNLALLWMRFMELKLPTLSATEFIVLPPMGSVFSLRIDGEARSFHSRFLLAVPEGLLETIAYSARTGILLHQLNKENMGLFDIQALTKKQFDEVVSLAEVEEDSTMAALKNQVKLLVDRVDSLEKENAALKAENAILKAENTALKAENAALKDENAALKAKVDRLETRVAELEEIVKRLSSALEKMAK